jgi:hypothetical protein
VANVNGQGAGITDWRSRSDAQRERERRRQSRSVNYRCSASTGRWSDIAGATAINYTLPTRTSAWTSGDGQLRRRPWRRREPGSGAIGPVDNVFDTLPTTSAPAAPGRSTDALTSRGRRRRPDRQLSPERFRQRHALYDPPRVARGPTPPRQCTTLSSCPRRAQTSAASSSRRRTAAVLCRDGSHHDDQCCPSERRAGAVADAAATNENAVTTGDVLVSDALGDCRP